MDELHCELATFLRNHDFELSRPPFRLERAASYYLRVGGEDNYLNAMECFSKAGKWKKVLEVSNKVSDAYANENSAVYFYRGFARENLGPSHYAKAQGKKSFRGVAGVHAPHEILEFWGSKHICLFVSHLFLCLGSFIHSTELMAKALILDPLDWELPSHYARLLFRRKKHLLTIPETSEDKKLFTTHQTIVEKHPMSKGSQESLSKNKELFDMWVAKASQLQSDVPRKHNNPKEEVDDDENDPTKPISEINSEVRRLQSIYGKFEPLYRSFVVYNKNLKSETSAEDVIISLLKAGEFSMSEFQASVFFEDDKANPLANLLMGYAKEALYGICPRKDGKGTVEMKDYRENRRRKRIPMDIDDEESEEEVEMVRTHFVFFCNACTLSAL